MTIRSMFCFRTFLPIVYSLVLSLPAPLVYSASQAQSIKSGVTPSVAPQPLVLSQSPKEYPQPIKTMLSRGKNVSVIDSFAVEGSDLTGWVMASGNDRRIYYVTKDGNYAILGLMFDGELNNVTVNQGKRYPLHIDNAATPLAAPVVTEAQPERAVNKATKSIERGADIERAFLTARSAVYSHSEGTGRDIYIVYDPACPYCHQIWRDTRGALGSVNIHWIPIAKVSKNSGPLAESLMASADRSKALELATEKQLQPAATVSSKVEMILSRNATILDIAKKKNVPFMLFMNQGKPASFLGLPDANMLSRILNDQVIPDSHGNQSVK